MPRRDEKTQYVMNASMRFVKTGDRGVLEPFSLSTLKKVDYQISDRDLWTWV